MSFTSRDLTPAIGAEVETDLATMLNGSSKKAFQDLLGQKGILLFRDKDLDDSQLLAFAKNIGVVRKEAHDPVNKVALTSQTDSIVSAYTRASFLWHVDSTYEDDPPAGAVMISRTLANEGGDTFFASTCAAYEALGDEDKALLEGLEAAHSMETYGRKCPDADSPEFRDSWKYLPDRTRPVVRPHRSGRKAIVLGASADRIVGMDLEEGRALIRRLNDWSTQERFTYRHKWRVGDVIIWDNTGTMHRVEPYALDCGRRHSRVAFFAGESTDKGGEYADGKEMLNRLRGGMVQQIG